MENRREEAGIKSSFILLFYGQSCLVYFFLTIGKDKIACFETCVNIINRKGFVCSTLHD